MSPNIVFSPVAVATAVAVPLTTEVPRKTRCGASAPIVSSWPTGDAILSAGSDSPVNIDC
jgi:hypothetical protein